MILRRFMQHTKEQNWFAVGLDVIVVIVGIFLGMQVTEWNESLQNKKLEIEYLDRMSTEFDQLIESEQGRLQWNEVRISQARKLLNVLRIKELSEVDESRFSYWIYYLGVINRPRLSWGVVEELRSTGNIKLISNVKLRKSITRMENEFLWYERFLDESAVIARTYRSELGKYYTIVQDENREKNLKLIVEYNLNDLWDNKEIINMIASIASYQEKSHTLMLQNIERLGSLSEEIKHEIKRLTGDIHVTEKLTPRIQ